jgi:dipeptidyl aminopeptidase/acylaminoacyl peptidase
MVSAFEQAGSLWDPPFEWIRWPYEGGQLVGYLVRGTGAAGRAPTVVYLNGADGTKEESWYLGGRQFVDRGINFVGIEGPGQGEPLRLHQLYTRPDYEVAIAPLLDLLAEHQAVDIERVGLVGCSMGGYYAGRLAAFEPRFRCTALLGCCFNVHDDLYEFLPRIRPQLQWITGTFEDGPARARLREFDLGPHLHRVRRPIYVMHGAGDPVVSPEAATKTAAALPDDVKTVRIWTSDGLGGSIHCGLDNPMQVFPALCDWVGDHLRD